MPPGKAPTAATPPALPTAPSTNQLTPPAVPAAPSTNQLTPPSLGQTGTGLAPTGLPTSALDTKTPCLYASHHISLFDQFGAAVGRSFQCALVYNNAAPGWDTWESPWFIGQNYADTDWGAWATAPGTHRRLIITQNMFPASEDSNAQVLAQGASGAFEGYARALATNLVNAGLGSSVIRLGDEANDTAEPDQIPNTPAGDAQWVQFWRNTVIAMRSVPGAAFQFDWCVNAGYRRIPLSDWYPGNDVVDIIGVDAYDGGVPASVADRWNYLYNEPDGIGAVEAFAVAHGKPLSIPEWGIGPARQPGAGYGGDDPTYVRGIAAVVANDNVAYQSYFDAGASDMQFFNSPASVQAYRQAFGFGGLAVRAADDMADPSSSSPTPSPAPSLAITGGPADASTVSGSSVTFDYAVEPGYSAVCSLDGQAWRSCTTGSTDVVQGLAAGYHTWNVQVTDPYADVSRAGRDFVVDPGP